MAAACILPQDADAELLAGINDSKDVDEQQREEIFERLIKHPGVRYGIGIKSHEEIDQVNILQATMLAMSSAVAQIPAERQVPLVSGAASGSWFACERQGRLTKGLPMMKKS